MIDFPISSAALRTVLGLAFAVVAITQVCKLFVTETRVLNLVAVAVGLIIGVVATFVGTFGQPTAEDLLQGVMVGVFAVAVATLTYDGVLNLAGLVGIGPKSDGAQLAKARKIVEDAVAKQADRDWLNQ